MDVWTRVTVTCPATQAEVVADRLWVFAPAAIEEQIDGSDTVLLAGFDDADAAAQAASAVRSLGYDLVEVSTVTAEGLDGWRDWAKAETAGPFVLVPAWLETPDVEPGECIVRLDPGHTFGSGSHPTTRAVLIALASRVDAATTVLDVGCGSGVLAVAAAMLGAQAVHGIDVDVESPSVVAANAAANGVDDVVTASNEPLSTVVDRAERYDVVAANLLAPVIVELSDDLEAVVAEGGTLVLSGLLADRWAQTIDHFTHGLPPAEAPWLVDEVVSLEGWVAVVLQRP
ncbi:MAG: 50S ribosomal protein L11 methyltransferase [Aquihabitans sp.]